METADPLFAAFVAAGLWSGLGRTTAGRLPGAGITGPETVTAERLQTVVKGKRVDRLLASWRESLPAYAVAEQLHVAGLAVRAAAAAVTLLGESAADRLAADPWRLLDTDAVSPVEADRFALSTLADRPGKDDPRRGRAFTAHVLRRAARDGHTALLHSTVASALAGLDVPDPEAALTAAVDDGEVLALDDVDEDGSPHQLVALARYAMAEDAIAEGLARLVATAEAIVTPEGATSVTGGLDPDQRAAVQVVAAHGVSLLVGGPGTGKSRTVAAVVELARARGRRIALAAPTGRAAKRLEELTDAEASTLHRLLGAQGTTGQFLRGETWPLDADLVVVDETSMLDVELAGALLDACADGTHLLFVGDPAQLPSIGAGRVLGDLVESGAVPITELTTLHRQAEGGTIARLAAAVRVGELPPVEDPTREVVVVPAAGSQEAARRVVQLVTDSIPRALGIEPADVQVVTPVHRGPAGTIELNSALKAILNPGSGTIGGYDVGDRVVATANHLDDGYANGEVGVVTSISDGVLEVAFGGGPAKVSGRAVSDLRHGWAVTVHRAQGSEWPAVVVVLPPEAGGMLSRPLVYTALTRAQRHLSVVHAAGAALPRAVAQVGARPRRTRLRRLMRELVSDLPGEDG